MIDVRVVTTPIPEVLTYFPHTTPFTTCLVFTADIARGGPSQMPPEVSGRDL